MCTKFPNQKLLEIGFLNYRGPKRITSVIYKGKYYQSKKIQQ